MFNSKLLVHQGLNRTFPTRGRGPSVTRKTLPRRAREASPEWTPVAPNARGQSWCHGIMGVEPGLGLMSHFGDSERLVSHHLQVSVGNYIPNIWKLYPQYLEIYFKYLLEIISPIFGSCETLRHLPTFVEGLRGSGRGPSSLAKLVSVRKISDYRLENVLFFSDEYDHI